MGNLVSPPRGIGIEGQQAFTQVQYNGEQGLWGCYTYTWVWIAGGWAINRIVNDGKITQVGSKAYVDGLEIIVAEKPCVFMCEYESIVPEPELAPLRKFSFA